MSAEPGFHNDFVEGVRRYVRQAQVELMAEPDPTSPWWFLVDPESFDDTA